VRSESELSVTLTTVIVVVEGTSVLESVDGLATTEVLGSAGMVASYSVIAENENEGALSERLYAGGITSWATTVKAPKKMKKMKKKLSRRHMMKF
jgi:hypothetical protein